MERYCISVDDIKNRCHANNLDVLFDKIIYSINLIRRAEKIALQLDPINGYYLAFSGGKDSQALYHLTLLAGVQFKAYMNLTSVDPPEVIRFVKKEYPNVELIRPSISIYSMAIKKKMLPTRLIRWCCKEFKESFGAGLVTLIGIRHAESQRRKKRQELSTQIKGVRNELSFDQWSEHSESMVTCIGGRDKVLLSPIIAWSDRDVWNFLNIIINVKHCILYDQGYNRIGCIGCPMSSYRQKNAEFIRWPHVRNNWLKVCKQLIDNGYIRYNFNSPEQLFSWWISGKNYNEWYNDSIVQKKINW